LNSIALLIPSLFMPMVTDSLGWIAPMYPVSERGTCWWMFTLRDDMGCMDIPFTGLVQRFHLYGTFFCRVAHYALQFVALFTTAYITFGGRRRASAFVWLAILTTEHCLEVVVSLERCGVWTLAVSRCWQRSPAFCLPVRSSASILQLLLPLIGSVHALELQVRVAGAC